MLCFHCSMDAVGLDGGRMQIRLESIGRRYFNMDITIRKRMHPSLRKDADAISRLGVWRRRTCEQYFYKVVVL